MLQNEQVFALLMERFDRLDANLEAMRCSFNDHVETDNQIHKIVYKHVTYWTLLLTIGAALLATVGTVLAAFIH